MNKPVSPSTHGTGHNSGSARVQIKRVAIADIGIWEPAKEQAGDLPKDELATQIELILEVGQPRPLPARERADGRIEVVSCAHVVSAIEHCNLLEPDRELKVELRIFQSLNDDDAYRLLAQDAEPGVRASPFARALLFDRAVKHFGSETKAAAACKVAKSTISKNRDVTRAAKALGDKIIVRRDITQRSAMWLMTHLGRHPHNGASNAVPVHREKLLTAIDALEPGTATQVFAALRKAMKDDLPAKQRQGVTSLIFRGSTIGELRRKPNGDLRLEFKNVGEIEAEELAAITREAISSARRSS